MLDPKVLMRRALRYACDQNSLDVKRKKYLTQLSYAIQDLMW